MKINDLADEMIIVKIESDDFIGNQFIKIHRNILLIVIIELIGLFFNYLVFYTYYNIHPEDLSIEIWIGFLIPLIIFLLMTIFPILNVLLRKRKIIFRFSYIISILSIWSIFFYIIAMSEESSAYKPAIYIFCGNPMVIIGIILNVLSETKLIRLQKISKILNNNHNVRISHLESVLNINRELLLKLIYEYQNELGIKIAQGEKTLYTKEKDVSNFIDILDDQFDAWDQHERKKPSSLSTSKN